MNLKDIRKKLTAFCDPTKKYEVKIQGKKFTVQEESMSNAMTLGKVVTMIEKLTDKVDKGFERINKRFDDLYKNNPTLVKDDVAKASKSASKS